MGVPKQLLKWNKDTLLGHAIKTSLTLPNFKTIVILGADLDRIYTKIKHHGIAILENKDWMLGLGTSIATGVAHILRDEPDCDGVMILLADQPLIGSSHLKSLIREFNPGNDQIIATSYSNGNPGVPVLFDRFYFKELAALKDDKGAKSILTTYSDNVLSLDSGHELTDIDTHEDYERLYSAYHPYS
jgi:molybdenum cofactor cytidylyltransferase